MRIADALKLREQGDLSGAAGARGDRHRGTGAVHREYNLAVCLQELGRSLEAVEYLRRAMQISPSVVQAHCLLGNVLLALGQVTEALAVLIGAVGIDARHGAFSQCPCAGAAAGGSARRRPSFIFARRSRSGPIWWTPILISARFCFIRARRRREYRFSLMHFF